MTDAKCPRCRGELEFNGAHDPGHGALWSMVCVDCRWVGPISCAPVTAMEASSHLAHFEPRPRLPTEDEERALVATHGKAAAWMVQRQYKGGEWTKPMWMDAEAIASWRYSGWAFMAYPVLDDGRPVAWPEVGG